MAWIELHQSIWTHKKTYIMAAELELDEIYVAAHMAKLWTWALDNAQDGDLSGLPYKVIAYGAGWKGDPGEFVRAAIKSGWLDENESGLFIHDWDDYAGKLMERRAAERDRSRKRRAESKQKQASQQTTDERPPVDQQTAVGTVPNLTVPNHNNNNNNDDDNARAREAELEEAQRQIVSTHNQEMGRLISQNEADELMAFVKDGMDSQVVCEAIKRTRLHGKTSVKYALSILRSWADQGVTSMAGVTRADLEFEKLKQQKANNPPIRNPGNRMPRGFAGLYELSKEANNHGP
ncbi:MAG: DnaD domain-containing protein [Bacillota bacterium]